MLTRKERKRLAKGKPLIKKKTIPESVPEEFEKQIVPFNITDFDKIDNNKLLDFISHKRRQAYTHGYISAFLAKNKHSNIIKESFSSKFSLTFSPKFSPNYPQKTDREIFLAIKSILNEEDKNIIIAGILNWFYNSCYSQGYSSYLSKVDVQLPIYASKITNI